MAGTEYIDTDELQHVATIGELRVELDHRACRGHLAQPGKCRIDRFVETAPRTSHLKICIARQKLHAKRKLVHCRTGNELYRIAERDPERDGEHRQHVARLVLRKRSGKYEPQRGYFCFVHQGMSSRRPTVVSCSARSHVCAAIRECVTRIPAAPFALICSRSKRST